ncbi:hypothetical protein QTP88_013674 [Uroleucon formosanum]
MKDTELCTDTDEISNLLGDLFYHNSLDGNFNATFLNNNMYIRNQQYTYCINSNLYEQTKLNSPIQLAEMVRAISKCTSIAPGPDGIPYCFIHNPLISALDSIVNVIPILKPNKNKFETKSCRPISLLNTMVKVLEKIINSRLRWFLEKTICSILARTAFEDIETPLKIPIFRTQTLLKMKSLRWPLWQLAKNNIPPIIFNQHLQSITSDLCDYTEMYTDGSKTDNGVGAAVVFKDHVSMLRLPNFCSIYSAEATAISYALDIIKTSRILKAAILSDSLSSLRSIENPFTTNEIARKIQNQLHNLTNSRYSIILIWIPSHSQITGNERADENARQAITSPDAIKLNGFTLHDAKSSSKTITSNIWLRA